MQVFFFFDSDEVTFKRKFILRKIRPMGSYTQILYQVVFRTKNNVPAMLKPSRQTLYEYMAGILKNKNCFCYQIGGVEDHLHLVFSLHPTVALADLVKDLKIASNKMIKETKIFPLFSSWADKYSAFTYAFEAKDQLINYVKNQEAHHAKKNLADELRELYKEHGIELDERYFMKD